MAQAHGVSSSTRVTADDARHVARIMAALSTPSRVRILARLREGECSVGDLAAAVQMEQPAVSHQLRILRDLGLVLGSRDGRHVIYGLYDPHVATLLDEALRHIAHLRSGAAEPPRAPTIEMTATTHRRSTMTEEHEHDGPHAHEHSHDDVTHSHAHSGHDHEHVEHEHEHSHDGESHVHGHVHEAGLEDVHEHEHA
jgi:ArsR family transcriptional regulator, nickel/cobalt-responsive transcriptional repressor